MSGLSGDFNEGRNVEFSGFTKLFLLLCFVMIISVALTLFNLQKPHDLERNINDEINHLRILDTKMREVAMLSHDHPLSANENLEALLEQFKQALMRLEDSAQQYERHTQWWHSFDVGEIQRLVKDYSAALKDVQSSVASLETFINDFAAAGERNLDGAFLEEEVIDHGYVMEHWPDVPDRLYSL